MSESGQFPMSGDTVNQSGASYLLILCRCSCCKCPTRCVRPTLERRAVHGVRLLTLNSVGYFNREALRIEIDTALLNQRLVLVFERINRSYRRELLDTWLFQSLDEVRELTWSWMLEWNGKRDRDS